MPNYCFNELKISGPKEDREKLRKAVQGIHQPWLLPEVGEDKKEIEVLSFHSIVPYPERFADRDAFVEKKKITMECLSCEKFYGLKSRPRPKGVSGIYKKEKVFKGYFCPKCGRKLRLYPDGYNVGGYNWCIENWGTKWEAMQPQGVIGKFKLWFTFDTAWSPPIPIVDALKKQYPSLHFTLTYQLEEEGRKKFYYEV